MTRKFQGVVVAAGLHTASLTMNSLCSDLSPAPGQVETGVAPQRLVDMWWAQKFLTSSRDIDTTSLGGSLWESANRHWSVPTRWALSHDRRCENVR
jgi:hypothetical protein